VSVINETDFAIKLQISDSDWSCDDYSGTDNPSALNGLVIPPNFGSTPLQIKVAAKWKSPWVKFGILGKLGSPDLVRYLLELDEVDRARVGGSAGHDDARLVLKGQGADGRVVHALQLQGRAHGVGAPRRRKRRPGADERH
jgi:hypothetical protein